MRNLLSSGSGLAQQQASVLGSGTDVNQLGSATAAMLPYLIPNLAAYYDFTNRNNLTVDASNRVSQANDISGNNRHLLQATGSAQPLLLPWSGTNYGYLSGVAANYFSTPDAAPLNITGDIDLRAYVALDSWTPGAQAQFICKAITNGQSAYRLLIRSDNKLEFSYSPDGGLGTMRQAVASTTTGITDGALSWVRSTYASATGKVNFYKSTDGTNWTQIGTEITITAGAIFAGTDAVNLGGLSSGQVMTGKMYRAQIYSGIGGTLKADFNPSQTTNNASSWTASTGEVWTVASTGSKPAQIVGKQSVLTDAAAYYMQSATYSGAQPVYRLAVIKQNTWGAGNILIDGQANTAKLYQTGSTPSLTVNAGADGPANTAATLLTWRVVDYIMSGASSVLGVDGGTDATGNASTGAPNGITIGASKAGANFAGMQIAYLFEFLSAPDAATRSRIRKWAARQMGLSGIN